MSEPTPSPMSRRDVAIGFGWTALFNFIVKAVFPLAALYNARTLGPSLLGIAATLQMILMFSEIFREAGLPQTYMADHEMDEKKEAGYVGMAYLSGFVPALVVLALTPLLTKFFKTPELMWSMPVISVVLCLNGMATISVAKMLKQGRIKEHGMIGVSVGAVVLAITIAMVALGVGFPALVFQMAAGSIATNLLIARRCPVPRPSFDRHAVVSTFRRTWAVLLANGLNNVFLLFDIFVITRLLGNVAAGYYNVAQNLAYKPFEFVSSPLARTLLVAFSQSAADMERLRRAFCKAVTAVVIMVIPVYFVTGFCADAIIGILYGHQFFGAIATLQILSIYIAFRTIGNLGGTALVPAGKHRWTLYPWILALAVTGTGLALIWNQPTLERIVWCFTAGAITIYGTVMIVAFRFLPPMKEDLAKLLKAVFVTGVSGTLIALSPALAIAPWLRLLLVILLVPPLHFVLLGTILAKRPLSYLTPSGFKELWKGL